MWSGFLSSMSTWSMNEPDPATAGAVLRVASQLVDGIQQGLARRGFNDVRAVHGFAFARLSGTPATASDWRRTSESASRPQPSWSTTSSSAATYTANPTRRTAGPDCLSCPNAAGRAPQRPTKPPPTSCSTGVTSCPTRSSSSCSTRCTPSPSPAGCDPPGSPGSRSAAGTARGRSDRCSAAGQVDVRSAVRVRRGRWRGWRSVRRCRARPSRRSYRPGLDQ